MGLSEARGLIAISGYPLLLCGSLQRFHQPRDDYFFEDSRIWPHANLSPEVASQRVDPCIFWDVAFAEQQVFVSDRYLRIEHSGNHEHRRHWLAQQTLMNQRHLRQVLAHS